MKFFEERLRIVLGQSIFGGTIFLTVVALVLGLGQLTLQGFSPPKSDPFAISVADAEQMKDVILWIDARSDDSFLQAHIPGALSLNRQNWEKKSPLLFGAFQPGKTIVVYCSPDCTESEEIAARIRKMGFDPVLYLEGGFESWRKLHPGAI